MIYVFKKIIKVDQNITATWKNQLKYFTHRVSTEGGFIDSIHVCDQVQHLKR